MPCVIMPRPVSNGKKLAASAVLGLFVVLLSAISMEVFNKTAESGQFTLVAEEKSKEPFDIVLDDTEADSSIEIQEYSDESDHAFKEHTLEVTVQDKDSRPFKNDAGETSADAQAAVARRLVSQGQIEQAVRYQRRAVELEPHNMFYRLGLAILHDRLADKRGAAILYKQIVYAYDIHDKTLPVDVDIESIRRRLAYLETYINER